MRSLLTWMMVFGIIAGLNLRVLAADGSQTAVCEEKVSNCCGNDHTTPPQNSHDHDGEDCPLDHHHHHDCCFHVMPLTLGNDAECSLGDPASTFLGFRHECEVPPDGPFLSSEKPPLI